MVQVGIAIVAPPLMLGLGIAHLAWREKQAVRRARRERGSYVHDRSQR